MAAVWMATAWRMAVAKRNSLDVPGGELSVIAMMNLLAVVIGNWLVVSERYLVLAIAMESWLTILEGDLLAVVMACLLILRRRPWAIMMGEKLAFGIRASVTIETSVGRGDATSSGSRF